MRTDLDRGGPGIVSQTEYSLPAVDRMRGPIPEHLARSFAEEILSRLVFHMPREHRHDEVDPNGASHEPGIGTIDFLCDALISDDPLKGAEIIEEAKRAGASPDAIYTKYISAAARRLGERWVADTASFFDVTLGLSRLHSVLREHRPSFLAHEAARVLGCRALLMPVPGETHVLGVTMAADYFRRAGWHVDLGSSTSLDCITSIARRGSYAMLGLSASCRQMIGSLTETIVALRFACPSAVIVVGGHITELEPDIAAMVGADSATRDVSTAAISMQRIVRTTT